jgi:hypothetical protein
VTTDQAVLLAVGVLALSCAAVLVALLVVTMRTRTSLRDTEAEVRALRARVDELEGRPAARAADVAGATEANRARGPVPAEFVITDLGRDRRDPHPQEQPAHLEPPAFADIVLKETVVKAASLAHGVRRGLSPATRHRIRFEMKQEVRRSRKQRRTDRKAVQRDTHARQRAALAEEVS